MDKNSKNKILIAVIIAAIAVVFIPIYIFVLADPGDDGKYAVAANPKIIVMEDGTEGFDLDDTAGNDSSKYNNIVRTFDSIKYTVSYVLTKSDPSAGNDIEGREVQVELLIPTAYSGVIRQGDERFINVYPGSQDVSVITKFGPEYYYATFNVSIAGLDVESAFDFTFENINSNDITSNNNFKPLIFLRETTEQKKSILDETVTTLPTDITCDIAATDDRPASNNCIATLSGKSSSDVALNDIAVDMFVGTPKVTETQAKRIPIGLLVGLKNQPNGKGIKGLTVPSQVSFVIANGDSSKLNFVENSLDDYSQAQGTDAYIINIGDNHQLPSIANGSVSGTITDNSMLNITISNIAANLLGEESGYKYFSSKYFVVELPRRAAYDYSDINVSLTSDKSNSSGQQSRVTISDSYNLVLGNYNSKVNVFDGSSNNTEDNNYGKANINYNGYYTLRTDFSYDSRTDSQGDGLTSLTNYIKIDNTALRLINNTVDSKPYNFIPKEITSGASIKEDVDSNGPKVYFGFGEWNANYFDVSPSAPAGCPSTLNDLSKEQIMNLYGGPCIVEKNTLQWARSPRETADINGETIDSSKSAMIVKSTFVNAVDNQNYITTGSGGTLELYGFVVDDPRAANNVYQIVTSATALGKDNTDFRYLGNEYLTGETFLTNMNNFAKTSYDFTNRGVIALNNNLCSNPICSVTGTSIITSGLRVAGPSLTTHRPTDLSNPISSFYNYPMAIKINANSISNDQINVDKAYVDVYLPSYMTVLDNYGDDEPVEYTVEDITLSTINNIYGFDAPVADENYKVYHYILNASSVSDFVVYADIDQINTPTYIEPWLYAAVDFEGTKTVGDDEHAVTYTFKPITSNSDRVTRGKVNIHNASPVISKGAITPRYIEKNGSFTYNMFAYNHSATLVTNGYTYPTADLYYVLPYDGNIADASMTSKVGTTKYKVNFTEETINNITNVNDYKFYYATSGVPANIINDEINTDVEPSNIWTLWENPTVPVDNVVAVKVVKQTPFAPGEYFGTTNGLTVNVETVGSTDSNIFYNTFSLLTSVPSNYECINPTDPSDEDYDPNYCDKAIHTKDNYTPSPSVTSVYSREISGLVFEDADYNGIFSSEEPRLKDVAVTLYKIDALPENYDPTDPSTYVKDTDRPVSYDNDKYNVADFGKISEYIPNSESNNSKALILPNTNKAVTSVITFTEDYTDGKNIQRGINMGLTVKKEMAVKLNKFITEVTVSRNGKEFITSNNFSSKSKRY